MLVIHKQTGGNLSGGLRTYGSAFDAVIQLTFRSYLLSLNPLQDLEDLRGAWRHLHLKQRVALPQCGPAISDDSPTASK